MWYAVSKFRMNGAIFLLLSLLAACQSSKDLPQAKVKQIRLNMKDEPQTLDPRKARDLNSLTLIRMLFEGLVRLNPQGEPECAMAEKIEFSPSMTQVTFSLREAQWSNGEAVCAEDFSRAWKQCLDPSFRSDMAFQLYVIKNAKEAKEGKVTLDEVGIHVLSPKVLEIELTHPIPYLLKLLAAPPFFPVHPQIDVNPSHMINNGPFAIKEWKPQDHLLVKKNPFYWDKETVRIEEIDLVMVPEETETMLFEKGALDWMGSPLSTIPVEAIKNFKNHEHFHFQEMLGTCFLSVNTQHPMLAHPKMRRALACAINRQAMVDHITQGNQGMATTLVPPSMGLSTVSSIRDNQPLEALTLFHEALSEMNLSPDLFSSVSLLYRSGERNHLIAQAIQNQWFEVFGIRLPLEAIEGKIFFDRVSSGQYAISVGSWIVDFEDPINFLEVFKASNRNANNTAWVHERFGQLIDQSLQLVDTTERRQVLAESEEILLEQVPIIPLFHYTMLYVCRPEVKNVVLLKTGQLDFKWAYIDQSAKTQ